MSSRTDHNMPSRGGNRPSRTGNNNITSRSGGTSSRADNNSRSRTGNRMSPRTSGNSTASETDNSMSSSAANRLSRTDDNSSRAERNISSRVSNSLSSRAGTNMSASANKNMPSRSRNGPSIEVLKKLRFHQVDIASEFLNNPLGPAREHVYGEKTEWLNSHVIAIIHDISYAKMGAMDWSDGVPDPLGRRTEVRREADVEREFYKGVLAALGDLSISLNDAIKNAVLFIIEHPLHEPGRFKEWKRLNPEKRDKFLEIFSVSEDAILRLLQGKSIARKDEDSEILLLRLSAIMQDEYMMKLDLYHNVGRDKLEEVCEEARRGTTVGRCSLCGVMLKPRDMGTNAEHRPVQTYCDGGPHAFGRSCLIKFLENGDCETTSECPVCERFWEDDSPIKILHHPHKFQWKFREYRHQERAAISIKNKLKALTAFKKTLPSRPQLSIVSDVNVGHCYRKMFCSAQTYYHDLGDINTYDKTALEKQIMDLAFLMFYLEQDRFEAFVWGDWEAVRRVFAVQVNVVAEQHSLDLKRRVIKDIGQASKT